MKIRERTSTTMAGEEDSNAVLFPSPLLLITPVIWQPAPGTGDLEVTKENTPAFLLAQDAQKSAGASALATWCQHSSSLQQNQIS